ncbi:MAG: S8 family serine peptidase [Chloroflexota bacterium]
MRANPDSPERLRLSNRTRLIVVMIEVIAMLAAMLGPAVAQDNGTSGSPSSQATVDTQPQQDAQPQADPTPAPTPDPTPDPTPKPDRPAQQQPDPAPQQQDPTPDPTPKAQADPTPQPVDPTPDPTPAPQPTPDAQPTPDQAQPTPDQSTPAPQPTPDQSTPNPDPATPDPANPTPDAQPTPDQSTPNPEQPTPAPTDTPAPSADPDASAAPSPSASPAPSASAAPSPSASPALPETKPLIVRFVAGTTAAQQDAVIAALGGTQTDSYPALRMRVIKVAPSLSAEIVAAYRADPRVATIENDRTRDADAAPNDPAWDNQWNLRQISWGKARDAANVADSATIAVLDTGVDGNHPDLASRIAGSWSAFPNGDALSDPNGHGTAMAGIAAAVPDNGDAVAGVAWANTSILAVQVLAADGTGQDSDIIGGVLWAADHDADVILMAFSNPGYSTALQAAVDYAWGRGAVLVAAAGNDGSSTPAYPGGDHHVMGVTATNSNDQLSAGANSGQAVFIAAPGDAIPATWPSGGWTTLGGTSPAAAQVAGAAAILKAIDPSAGNGELVGRLARTADPAGAEWETGNGRINLQRAAADSGSAWIDPSGAPGGGPYVGPYTAAATIYWVGCANTDWTNANNWSTSSSATCSAGVPSTGAGAPVGTDTATILTGKTNYPSIPTGTVTISTLTINSGGTVTVAGGTLAVTLTFTDTGTLTISSGVMTVASTNTSTIASGGVLNVNGGSFQTSGALSVSGTINQAGGVLHMNVALATKPSVSVTLNATGRLNLSAGSFETYSFVAASGSASTQTGGTFKLYRNFQNSGTYAGSAGTFEVAGSGSSSSAFNSPGTNRFYNVLVDSGITARFSSVSNFAMSVRGDWTINGTASLTSRNTTVTFDGTGTQTIGGTSSTTFRNLIVNKTSGSLVLAQHDGRDHDLQHGRPDPDRRQDHDRHQHADHRVRRLRLPDRGLRRGQPPEGRADRQQHRDHVRGRRRDRLRARDRDLHQRHRGRHARHELARRPAPADRVQPDRHDAGRQPLLDLHARDRGLHERIAGHDVPQHGRPRRHAGQLHHAALQRHDVDHADEHHHRHDQPHHHGDRADRVRRLRHRHPGRCRGQRRRHPHGLPVDRHRGRHRQQPLLRVHRSGHPRLRRELLAHDRRPGRLDGAPDLQQLHGGLCERHRLDLHARQRQRVR